jgi:putative peptidoglycan lipid II flippase
VFRYRFYLNFQLASLQEIWALVQTDLFGITATQVIVVLEKVIGSFLPAGTISALSYATHIVRAGTSVVVSSIGQVAIPTLAIKYVEGLFDELYRSFISNLQMMVYLTFPLTAVFIVLRVPLITIMLQRGAVTTVQVSQVTSLLSITSIGVLFSGLYEIALVGLYVSRRIKSIYLLNPIYLSGLVIWGALIGFRGDGRGLALVYPLMLVMCSCMGYGLLRFPNPTGKQCTLISSGYP